MSTIGARIPADVQKQIAWVKDAEASLAASRKKAQAQPYRPPTDRELDDMGSQATFSMVVAQERKRLQSYGFTF